MTVEELCEYFGADLPPLTEEQRIDARIEAAQIIAQAKSREEPGCDG